VTDYFKNQKAEGRIPNLKSSPFSEGKKASISKERKKLNHLEEKPVT